MIFSLCHSTRYELFLLMIELIFVLVRGFYGQKMKSIFSNEATEDGIYICVNDEVTF